MCMPLFHAFIGCDQVSFFSGKGKNACKNWMNFPLLDSAMMTFTSLTNNSNLENCFSILEKIVVLMYDSTSTSNTADEARKILFAKKGRSLECIPPTSDALFQHTKRALYQGGLCWGRSLQREQKLPSPTLYGWKMEEDIYRVHWMTIPESSEVCRELIRCGCKTSKGCSGRCICKKNNLKCTDLCSCA